MGFVISFMPLFEIIILHHYHLDRGGEGDDYVLFDLANEQQKNEMLRNYDISSFLQIEPSPACAVLLKKHQCIFRRYNDRIQVAVKVQLDGENYKPFVPFADDLVFTFRYRINDPDFYNYTNLPLKKDKNTTYFFQNIKQAGARTYPSLSVAAPKIIANEIYNAGEILLSDDGLTVVIAGNITGPVNTPAQPFTSDMKVDDQKLSYVNRQDQIRTSGNLFTINTGLVERRENVAVEVKNYAGETITPEVKIMENGNTIVQLNLHPFTEGVYQINLKDAAENYDEELLFYLQKENNAWDGYLQIQVKSDDASYNLLNDNGSVKKTNQLPGFELRFKNRATVWRYVGKDVDNKPESGPHLLTRNGFVNLVIPDQNNNPINDPPNPSTHIIVAEKPVAAPQYYNIVSEIYLNS